MNNINISLDNILYKNEAPWLPDNTSNEKFESKIHSVKEYSSIFTPQFSIEFERPFNSKTKYYAKFIINESINITNQLFNTLSEADNKQLKAFWIDKIFEKKLKTRLMDIGKIIKEKDFDLAYINPKKTSFDIDQNHKSDTYIIQLLKLSLMQIYLELQKAFRSDIYDILIADDFYTQLLLEPIPEKSYLKEIVIIDIEPVAKPKIIKKEATPIGVAFHSFTYKQLATESDKLTDLHDSLKKNNFIASDTTLTNFKKVFSGKEISIPVKWNGNISEFYYFIKLIYTDFKLVNDLKQKQWEIACKCFVTSDGSQFERSKLRGLKRPSNTGDLLDSAVELIK